jgi:hypothetical protein
MIIEAIKLAIKTLQKCEDALAEELSAWDINPPLHHVQESHDLCEPTIKVLEEALAKQEQGEPVACNIQMDECSSQPEQAPRCMTCGKWTDKPCRNTTPQQRTWVGLTDEEMKKTWYEMQNIMGWYSFQEIANAIQEKLKEKNNA